MNIVTDNSAVIEALNKRIEKLESYNAGLANESCEQQAKIRKLKANQERAETLISEPVSNTHQTLPTKRLS